MKTWTVEIPPNPVANWYQGKHDGCVLQITSNVDDGESMKVFKV